MTRIFSGVLRVIDRIFQLDGSQVTIDAIDTTSTPPVVVDVSRLAQLASSRGAYGGFSSVSFGHTHAVVADEVFSSFDPYDPTLAIMRGWSNPRDCWHWVMWDSIRVAPTLTLTEAVLVIDQGGVSGAITNHQFAIGRWAGNSTIAMQSAGDLAGTPAGTAGAFAANRPVLIPLNSTLKFASKAGGAVAALIGQVTIWTGPFGVTPPGMA